VTRNNVKDTVLKDGYWTVQDVCTENYAQDCARLGIE